MRPFKFELKSLLDLRTMKESQERTKLGEIVGAIQENRQIIELKKRELQDYFTQQEDLELSPELAKLSLFGVMGARQKIADLLAEQEKLILKREEQKKVWLTAKSAVRILEKLKDKKQRQYKKDSLKREERYLHELFTLNEYHKKIEGDESP